MVIYLLGNNYFLFSIKASNIDEFHVLKLSKKETRKVEKIYLTYTTHSESMSYSLQFTHIRVKA